MNTRKLAVYLRSMSIPVGHIASRTELLDGEITITESVSVQVASHGACLVTETEELGEPVWYHGPMRTQFEDIARDVQQVLSATN